MSVNINVAQIKENYYYYYYCYYYYNVVETKTTYRWSLSCLQLVIFV
jgi:hypothetical protein